MSLARFKCLAVWSSDYVHAIEKISLKYARMRELDQMSLTSGYQLENAKFFDISGAKMTFFGLF